MTHPALDPAGFRRAAGQFASGTMVAAVTTRGVSHALTVSTFASVSLDPLLVLICVDRAAPFHDAILAAGTWALSVLGEDAEKTARALAALGDAEDPPAPDAPDALDAHPHHPGAATGDPILDGALAAIECQTHAVHPGGDHTIVIGEVLAVTGPPGGANPRPLIRHAGRYRRLPA